MSANRTENAEGNAQGVSFSEGVALGSRLQRGRWFADVRWMIEDIQFLENSRELSLTTVSMGIHYRFNRAEWSLTGLARENVLNNKERILALGLRVDVARGISLNTGIRLERSNILDETFRTYALSIRYEL